MKEYGPNVNLLDDIKQLPNSVNKNKLLILYKHLSMVRHDDSSEEYRSAADKKRSRIPSRKHSLRKHEFLEDF